MSCCPEHQTLTAVLNCASAPGTNITLVGSKFGEGVGVEIHGRPCSLVSRSWTQLVFTAVNGYRRNSPL